MPSTRSNTHAHTARVIHLRSCCVTQVQWMCCGTCKSSSGWFGAAGIRIARILSSAPQSCSYFVQISFHLHFYRASRRRLGPIMHISISGIRNMSHSRMPAVTYKPFSSASCHFNTSHNFVHPSCGDPAAAEGELSGNIFKARDVSKPCSRNVVTLLLKNTN